jgi:hypothetical protein
MPLICSASGTKERRQKFSALIPQHTFLHLDAVIHPGLFEYLTTTHNRTSLGLTGTKYQT